MGAGGIGRRVKAFFGLEMLDSGASAQRSHLPSLFVSVRFRDVVRGTPSINLKAYVYGFHRSFAVFTGRRPRTKPLRESPNPGAKKRRVVPINECCSLTPV